MDDTYARFKNPAGDYSRLSPVLQYIFNQMYKEQLDADRAAMPQPQYMPEGAGVSGIASDANNNSVSPSAVSPGQAMGMVGMAVSPVMGLAKALMSKANVAPLSVQVADAASNHNTNAGQQVASQVSQAVQDAVAAQIGLAAVDPSVAQASTQAGIGDAVGVDGTGVADNASPSDFRRGGPIRRYGLGGSIEGQDGGMDDTVATTIEGAEPAALSHGEYVLPADVVSALGDGNTKAGVKKIEGLISAIRTQKYGRDKQPPRLKSGILSLLERGKI